MMRRLRLWWRKPCVITNGTALVAILALGLGVIENIIRIVS